MKQFFIETILCLLLFAVPVFAAVPVLELEKNVVRDGETNRFRLTGMGTADSAGISVTVTGENNAVATAVSPRKIALAQGKSEWLPVPMPKSFGIWTVQIKNGGRELKRAFAFLPPPVEVKTTPEDFLLGVHEEPYRYPAAEQEILFRYYVDGGFMIMRSDRVGLEWYTVEPAPGKWDFRKSDAMFERLRKHGIKLMLLGCLAPSYAKSKGWKATYQGSRFTFMIDPAQYYTFWRKVAERYGDSVLIWEIGDNEPDLLAPYTVEEYLQFFAEGTRAVKSVLPHARVANAGFAEEIPRSTNTTDPNFVAKFLKQAPADSYDMFNVHRHGEYPEFRDAVKRIAQMLKDTGVNKPMLFGETAITVDTLGGEYHQAEVLWKKVLYAWSSGAVGYIWYNLRDSTCHPASHSEANFGLLTQDMQPKPDYAAYCTLIQNFKGAKFIKTFRDNGKEIFFLFRAADGSYLIPFWTQSAADRKLWMIGNAGTRAELIDLWGNAEKMNLSNGIAILMPKVRPQLLKVSGGTGDPVFEGELLAFDRELSLPRGGELHTNLILNNRFGGMWRGEIRFSLPPHLTIVPARISFQLPPDQTGKFPLKIGFRKDGSIPVNASGELAVQLTSPMLTTEVLKYPVKSAILIQTQYSAEPAFTLNRRDQAITLLPSAAKTAKYIWHSPADLSAQIYMKRDDKHLYVQVRVRDDIHRQTQRGAEIWKGDSVQLGIAVPGQQGCWELGFAAGNDGKMQKFCWTAPSGFSPEQALEDITGSVRRNEADKETVYEIAIHDRAIGLSPDAGKSGVRFTVLVNDDDLGERETMMRLTDGIGNGLAPMHWIVVSF